MGHWQGCRTCAGGAVGMGILAGGQDAEADEEGGEVQLYDEIL